MSNLEADPVPRVCEGGAVTTSAPGLEILEPREVPLGGPRAMPVLRVLPNRPRHLIGAWCFADVYGPVDLTDRPGMAVPPHPHTGLQTVTWLAAGEIDHRDSLGSFQRVEHGGVSIMTAGHGISHSEFTPPEHSGVLHGVQLWIALPGEARDREPMYEGLAHNPRSVVRSTDHGGGEDPTVGPLTPGVVRVDAAGATDTNADGDTAHTVAELSVEVFVGEFHGLRSEATVFTPLVGAGLSAGGAAVATTLQLESTYEHGVLAVGDGVSVEGVALADGSMAYLPEGTDRVAVRLEAGAHAVLLGGEPFDETFVMFWNFVAPTTELVREARTAWQVECDADFDAAARPRFGVVEGHDGVTLAAPEMPEVPLRPRGRLSRPVPPPKGMLGGRGPA